MVGVPGLAKTLMVTTFAETLGLTSSRIQFTPDLMPSDIIGSNVIQEGEDGRREFEFVEGPVFTQLLLADEINRTPPKTQSALLEAMQERQVTVGNRTLPLPSPFCVIATQNPIEQEGTYPLPEAQQDRFMLCMLLDYPNRDEEIEILVRTSQRPGVPVEQVLSHPEILAFQGTVDRVSISRELVSYTADLVRATRPGQPAGREWVSEVVDWGAGPRAGQSILRMAKAIAAMDGRPAIAHDDVREAVLPALRHRVCCNYRARTKGLNEDRLVQRILEEIGHG
jgi:MoxR-like ATPase